MYSLFTTDLPCPDSGELVPAWIQTKLPRDERAEPYRPGEAVDIVPPEVAGYLPLRPWRPGEPLHLLESWGGTGCEHEPNWADVTIADGKLQSISATPLDGAALDRAHYITPELDLYYDQITGERLYPGGKLREDFADLLRRSL
jgi:hypothetical protein